LRFSVWLNWPVSTGTTTSAASETWISCFVPATSMTRFGRLTEAPWVRRIPLRSSVSSPGNEIVTVYVPGGTDGNVNTPLEFVTVSRVMPLASFFSTTLAFGTTPPVRSTTVPLMDALPY
jgi:hypothetical protein